MHCPTKNLLSSWNAHNFFNLSKMSCASSSRPSPLFSPPPRLSSFFRLEGATGWSSILISTALCCPSTAFWASIIFWTGIFVRVRDRRKSTGRAEKMEENISDVRDIFVTVKLALQICVAKRLCYLFYLPPFCARVGSDLWRQILCWAPPWDHLTLLLDRHLQQRKKYFSFRFISRGER